MKPARPLLVLAAVGLILMPSSALAGGRGGVVVMAPRSSVVIASPSTVGVRTTPRIFVPRTGGVFVTGTSPHHFFPHHFFPHQFFPSFGTGVIVSSPFFPVSSPFFPTVASAPPAIESSPPGVYAQPPPSVSVAPSPLPTPYPLPTPTVIEYPTGWYQLRGDGVTTPYAWVWIPKPPPAPPSEAPPTVPPAPPSTAPGGPRTVPPVQSRSSESSGKLYRWTDEQGVAHLTDRLNSIPERYRSEAQRWS